MVQRLPSEDGNECSDARSFENGNTRSVSNCSLRSLRIALESRLLRRRSGTKSVSPRSSSARRRAIRED